MEEPIDPIQKLNELYEKSLDLFKKTDSLHEKIQTEMEKLKRENVSLLVLLTKEFTVQKDILKELKKVMVSTDDTLLNVLLAIKQNEYLQAYYPEQAGYPAMKVTGTHPKKLDARVK